MRSSILWRRVRATAGAGVVDRRGDIIRVFGEMAGVNSALGLPFKSKAYLAAIEALTKPTGPIVTADDATRALRGVAGVGTKLVDKAREIATTGSLKELEVLAQHPQITALRSITSIHGFGPAGAKKLYSKLKVKGIDDIRRLAKARKLQLTAAQQLGLKYYDDFNRKIPHAEVALHEKLLKQAVESVDRRLQLCICGSYRRKRPMSGDVDALLTFKEGARAVAKDKINETNSALGSRGVFDGKSSADAGGGSAAGADALKMVVDALKKDGYVIDVLALGTTKFMGVARLPSAKHPTFRRIDIRWVEPECYPTAVLYFTGSKAFNTRMRGVALSQGYTLNEYGIFKGTSKAKGGRVEVKSEKDVFDLLGMPYLEPPQRES